MSDLDIIRAWKDPEFRSTLASIPAHPAGEIDLAGAGLDGCAAHNHTKDCTGGLLGDCTFDPNCK
jgi:mersacidin/lichenicidin family type 2 lantibiotic